MVGPGVHINAIGGDCPGKTELDARILGRGDVFVEFPAQTRLEGEIQQVEPDFPVTELWKSWPGRRQGAPSPTRSRSSTRSASAIEDFSALRYLRDSVDGTFVLR